MLLCTLSRDNLPLAIAEISTLSSVKKIDGSFALVNGDEKELQKRLAYTHAIHEFLFEADEKSFESKLEEFDWSIIDKSFAVRVHNAPEPESYYANLVWKKISHPLVDLKNPEIEIHIFFHNIIYACIFIGETDKSYLERKPHERPEMHPTSLSPKLAKCCVNLTGAGKNDTIVDPFCGSGGILIEAGLMGMKTVGYDISKKMLDMAEKNISHYGIKKYSLEQKDSTKLSDPIDYAVTDLPYGINSKLSEPIAELYENFLKALQNILKKRAVVMFPHTVPNAVDSSALLQKHGFYIVSSFDVIIHNNLTKKIYVVE